MEDKAYSYIFYDILGKVMQLSDNPSHFAEYLSKQIREFIGARTVVITIKDKKDLAFIYNVFPSRKKEWCNRPEILQLAEHSFTFDKVKILCKNGDDSLVVHLLSLLEIEKTIAIPLIAGDRFAGSILLLDIMDMNGIDSVLDLLQRLSGVFALIIRNSLLYHNLEELVEERTKELQKRNEELLESEMQLQAANEEYESLNEDLFDNIDEKNKINEQLIISKEQAEENEMQFRNLFEHSADAIFIAVAETGILVDVNQSAERLMKMTRNEIIGMHQTQLHPPEVIDNARDTFNNYEKLLNENNASHILENFIIRKDGSIVPVEILASKVIYKGEKCLVGTFRDITERKKAEEAYKKSEEKYRLQFLNMSSYNSMYEVVYDNEGKPCDFRFIMVNHAYEDYVGVKASDIIGKTLLEVFPTTEKYWIDKLTEAAISGEPCYLESFSSVMNTYIEINLYTPQPGQLAMTTANIT